MTLFWRQTALFDPSMPAKGAFSRAQIIVNAAKYLRLWTETRLGCGFVMLAVDRGQGT
jgi:hypothetical protein